MIDFQKFTSALQAAGFAGDLITHGLSATEALGVSTFLKNALAQADTKR